MGEGVFLGSVISWSVGIYMSYRHDFSSFVCFVLLLLRLTFMYPMLASNFYIDEVDLECWSSCFYLEIAGMTGMHHYAPFFVVPGMETGLVHTRQACYPLSYSPQFLQSFLADWLLAVGSFFTFMESHCYLGLLWFHRSFRIDSPPPPPFLWKMLLGFL